MTTLGLVAAGLLVLLAVVAVVAARLPVLERPVRAGVVAAELVAVVVVVLDLGLVLGADAGDRPDSLVTHLGYAVASLGLIPALLLPRDAAGGDDPEPEPVSLWVVAIVLLAVAVCLWRLAETR